MCCCCGCSCNASPKGLVIALFIFSFIIFELSLDNVFYRLGSTDRYQEALIYLKEKENKIYSFGSSCYEELSESSSSYGYYPTHSSCKVKVQSKKIRSKSLYKSWKDTDLALNIIRILITFACFVFLLYLLLKYFNVFNVFKDPNHESNIKKYLYIYFLTTLILSIVILVYSIIYIVLRVQVDKANSDIGLYSESILITDTWTSMVLAGNYFDISLMIMSIVVFSLSLALKKAMNNNTELPQYAGPTIIAVYNNNNNNQGSSPNPQSGVTSPDGRQAQTGQSEERKIESNP